MKEEIIIMKTDKIKTPKIQLAKRIGAGAGHLTGAVKSTTSIGGKTKSLLTRVKNDFKSGYKSAKTKAHQESPY